MLPLGPPRSENSPVRNAGPGFAGIATCVISGEFPSRLPSALSRRYAPGAGAEQTLLAALGASVCVLATAEATVLLFDIKGFIYFQPVPQDYGDFVAFQNAFTSADPSADCTQDCDLNILDFVCFQSAFQEPCD